MTESLPKLLVIGLLAGAVIVFGHYVGYVRGLSIADPSTYATPDSHRQIVADHEHDSQSADGSDDDAFEALLREPLPRVLNPALQWQQQARKQFYRQGLVASMMDPLPSAWYKSLGAKSSNTEMKWIALIIDDVGISWQRSQRAVNLGVPLTISLLPYGRRLQELAEDANARGHDVLVHVPMEPIDKSKKPGRMALRTDIPKDDILGRLQWNLGQFGGYVGINNHMGSFFTSDRSAMNLVMREAQRRGLLFLDSVTSRRTIAIDVANRVGVTSLARDVFIDDIADTAMVAASLRDVERIASKRGWAVAIAHPLPLTLGMLEVWIDEIRDRGYNFITVSQMAMLNNPPQVSRDVALSSPAGNVSIPSGSSTASVAVSKRGRDRSVKGSVKGSGRAVNNGNANNKFLLVPLKRPNQSETQRNVASLNRKNSTAKSSLSTGTPPKLTTNEKSWPNILAKVSSDELFDKYSSDSLDSSQRARISPSGVSVSNDPLAPVPIQPDRGDKIGMLGGGATP